MSLEKKIRSFLQGPRKGETFELKNGLVSQYKHERKDSIQRVIQAMTLGKDVSSLFPDVLKNIATYDLEQKKLVYLYLMNYAKTHPELCILAVNTFVQDTEDPNPLIRALAIRTMGCIRVNKMVDYMEIPLLRTLQDENPYVRKTAALCVAKLFNLNPQTCIEYGFLDTLKNMINDPNPTVISNALSALYEIHDLNINSNSNILILNYDLIKNLLICLNECTEWGRITILKCLNDYDCENQEQANHIIERVIPQLQHINPSIVLSSIKTILKHVILLPKANQTNILKKLSSPMVSLVSNSIPEAQYVGLKNIRIILEKYPNILSREVRVFFIKYSDPLYLKLEKLEIMVRLSNENNFNLVLNELREYSMEFEPSLVLKSLTSIGLIAVKLPSSIIKCINLIIELIDSRGGDLIVNESINVLTMILRKQPGRNDLLTLILPIISNHHNELDKLESLSNFVWLVGEYPTYFTQLSNLLNDLFDQFEEFDSPLKLNWLNTIVKINLNPNIKQDFSKLLQQTLTEVTESSDDIDLRDRAYIYWRVLSSSSSNDLSQNIILHKLPPIDSSIPTFSPMILDELMKELSTLSSVYGKPSSTFIKDNLNDLHKDLNIEDLQRQGKQEIINNSKNENLLDLDDDGPSDNSSVATNENNLLDELNDLFSNPTAPQKKTDDILDIFGQMSMNDASTNNNNNNNNNNNTNNHNTASIGDLGSLGSPNTNGNSNSSTSSNNNANQKGSLNNDLLDLF